MVNETILAIIIAFAISAALCPVIIPFLHRLKFGQQVRDDGPQSHLKKQGTPTMGGLIILTAIVITSLFYIKSYPRIHLLSDDFRRSGNRNADPVHWRI